MSDIAKKQWLNTGSPMTHGEFEVNVAKADAAKAGTGTVKTAIANGDCPGILEQRGYREINDTGATYVDWFGSYHHVMLFCPFCQPDMSDAAYVTTVPRNASTTDGTASSKSSVDLW